MTTDIRVELYLREGVPEAARASQQSVRRRLRSLEREGVLSALDVRTWGHRARSDDPAAGQALSAYDQFRGWARSHDASLRPAFDAHAVRSVYTDTEYTTTVLPVTCLVVYENDRIAGVYPHERHGRIETVEHGLQWLEGRATAPGAGRAATPDRLSRDQPVGRNR